MAERPPFDGVEFLPFPADELTKSLRVVLFEFCSTLDWLRAAYVCEFRRTDSGGEVVEEKSLVALASDPSIVLGSLRSPRNEARGMFKVLPETTKGWGLMILAEEATQRWHDFAICVFAREPPSDAGRR